MKVAILPTGRTEWHGLSQAFQRLFPGHDFYCLPTKEEVQSYPDEFPYNGFTGNALGETHEQNPPEAAVELVERAAQAGVGDKRRSPADLVLIVDDLELENAHQPERVVAVMRKAVEQHLAKQTEQTRRTLRAKVSFHLIAPMIEAWFFADPEALFAAGVPAGELVCFKDEADPEAFETDDAAYLAATEAFCKKLSPDSFRRKKNRPKWLGGLPRNRHPKGYLQWLCRDSEARTCTNYSETKSGGPALAGLTWEVLLKRPPAQFAFLRALIDDLEEGLGTLVPAGSSRQVAELTRRRPKQTGLVLRNI